MKARTTEELFDARAVKLDGCWLWGGYKNAGGYGCIRPGGRSGKLMLAHRLSWMIYRGPIPEGMHVLHKCDNPECTNPDHLFVGTNLDNIRDRVAKGRPGSQHWRNCTENHPRSKLSNDDVNKIRERRKNGDRCIDLAKEFGVVPRTVSAICIGISRRASS